LLNYQNNYVEISNMMSNAAKSFDVLAIGLNVLHNYFDSPNYFQICIYLNFYTSPKLFFPYI